jgi:hypothetical protein
MRLGKASSLSVFVEMVRKYLREIVPPVDTESTLVLLARMDELSRLSGHLSLTVAE